MERGTPPLEVGPADIAILRRLRADLPADAPLGRRARVVLLSAEGLGTSAAARELKCSKQTVTVWRERYRTEGLDGLIDAPRTGRPASVDPVAVLLRTMTDPGSGRARWSTRTLAADLGISNAAVANQWRYWGIRPAAGGRVTLLTEPVLDTPVVAVRGLHIEPRLRVLAVAVSPDGPPAPGPTGAPRDVGDAVGRLLARAGTGAADALEGFLVRLRAAEGSAGTRVELIVDGDAERVDLGPAGVVHVVPADRSWLQLVRVGCFAASMRGAASSVDALLT